MSRLLSCYLEILYLCIFQLLQTRKHFAILYDNIILMACFYSDIKIYYPIYYTVYVINITRIRLKSCDWFRRAAGPSNKLSFKIFFNVLTNRSDTSCVAFRISILLTSIGPIFHCSWPNSVSISSQRSKKEILSLPADHHRQQISVKILLYICL